MEGSSCALIAALLQLALSGAAEAFRWFWVPPYKELKSHTDKNIQALPAERNRRHGAVLHKVFKEATNAALLGIKEKQHPRPKLGQTGQLWYLSWTGCTYSFLNLCSSAAMG